MLISATAEGKAADQPEPVEIHNGSVALHALLLLNHGRSVPNPVGSMAVAQ
jgi:hypothetical protein